MAEFDIPGHALAERFITASGPGGQNVNKVATAVQLRLDVGALGLHPAVYARLRRLAGARWNADGSILLTARRFRTQEANRADARARLAALLAAAHVREERRIATRPSRAAKVRRVEAKARRGQVKQGRGRPTDDV